MNQSADIPCFAGSTDFSSPPYSNAKAAAKRTTGCNTAARLVVVADTDDTDLAMARSILLRMTNPRGTGWLIGGCVLERRAGTEAVSLLDFASMLFEY